MIRPALRPARPEHARVLADLAGEAFDEYGDYRPMVAAWAADPPVEVTLAEHDGAPVGAAFLVVLRPDEAPDTKVGDLLALAHESLQDGCLNEGQAAAVAADASVGAGDPAARAVLAARRS